MTDIDEVLEFWFGKLDADGLASDAARSRWYSKNPDFDREIRERFAGYCERFDL